MRPKSVSQLANTSKYISNRLYNCSLSSSLNSGPNLSATPHSTGAGLWVLGLVPRRRLRQRCPRQVLELNCSRVVICALPRILIRSALGLNRRTSTFPALGVTSALATTAAGRSPAGEACRSHDPSLTGRSVDRCHYLHLTKRGNSYRDSPWDCHSRCRWVIRELCSAVTGIPVRR